MNHSWDGGGVTTEMQLVYSTAPADKAFQVLLSNANNKIVSLLFYKV